MLGVREILEGYCDPQAKAISPRPIGQTGLTSRVGSIAYFTAIATALERRQCYRIATTFFGSFFASYLHTIQFATLVELLRVMDREAFGSIPMLTVSQCHARFVADPTPSPAQRQVEQTLYDDLDNENKRLDLRRVRNKAMFHLDLPEVLPEAVSTRTRTH